MPRLVQVLALAALISIAAASGAAATLRKSAAPRVELRPAVTEIGDRETIRVFGVQTRSVEVRLVATDVLGRPFPWRPLTRANGAWVGTLPAPVFLGVYPVLLRTSPAVPLLDSQPLFLRLFEPGTRARPAFDNPVDVARWWVRNVAHGTLVAVKTWPRPPFDRRDARLHRLFVVSYSVPRHPHASERLGMFITAFRDGYDAPWQLLEATVEP